MCIAIVLFVMTGILLTTNKQPEPIHIPKSNDPPISVQETVHMMDLGASPPDWRMEELSAWMEEYPNQWNRWCEEERKRHD